MIPLTKFSVKWLAINVAEFHIDDLTYQATSLASRAVYDELRRAIREGDTPRSETLQTIEDMGARRVFRA